MKGFVWKLMDGRYVTIDSSFEIKDSIFYKAVVYQQEEGPNKNQWACLIFDSDATDYVPIKLDYFTGYNKKIGLLGSLRNAKLAVDIYFHHPHWKALMIQSQ